VRLMVEEGSPFRATLDERTGEIVIWKGTKELVRGKLEEELIHCPGQAYITISERCIFDCKFCPVPRLQGKVKSLEEIVALADEASKKGTMKSISLTSGVADSPEKEVMRAVEAVRALQKYNVPIGVSVYPTKDSSRLLREAGADEVKYNVETLDHAIYGKVCGRDDLAVILRCLKDAVKLFGKGKVFSNFIIGLGESDETVTEGVEELARMGVIPVLRAAGMHPLRFGEIDVERPTAERILRLTKMLQSTLDRYGLDAAGAKTMCLPCTGCDLNPHIDL
ncbi:MAG TPA: radical SAM protein, partial [Candidatus Methanoperedenaceae archaeon]|nr:radical SAM protein [Candidatus Methanoperedenaceae archaeon]